MIYFDENKKAYGFEIKNPIATVEDEKWSDYAATDKWDIIDGKFTDITDTDDYKAKATAHEKEDKATKIQAQIDDLDKKRIRAIAEPQLKDQTTGQTWLEFYTAQITDLRKELSSM